MNLLVIPFSQENSFFEENSPEEVAPCYIFLFYFCPTSMRNDGGLLKLIKKKMIESYYCMPYVPKSDLQIFYVPRLISSSLPLLHSM